MAYYERSEKLEHYDSEKLIKEVEKRECLWNKNIAEFNDRTIRDRHWRQVCAVIVDNWENLSKPVQEKTVREVQRKWKNIKDCFRKEINIQRMYEQCPTMKRKKRYLFYEKLRFLIPILEEKPTDPAQALDEETNQSLPVYSGPSYQTYNLDDTDEDKYFLMSLVPTFRMLTEEQKFNARIAFLTVLKKHKLKYNSGHGNHPLHTSYDMTYDDDEDSDGFRVKEENDGDDNV